MMTDEKRSDSFYVVAKEAGAEHPALPTWANEKPNPVNLAKNLSPDFMAIVKRVEVEKGFG